MEKQLKITEYFASVETTKEHSGYFCSVGEALTVVILGSLCGLRCVKQIHQWASSTQIRGFMREHFEIKRIPCYYWLLCLLKMIDPHSLNRCFTQWVQSFLPKEKEEMTISFDGKTIRSTAKMDAYTSPMHIVSAYIAELGVTLASQKVSDKSNEIPAVRELLSLLEIEGCMVVADALHCQKETASSIVERKANYLLSVKENQPTLKKDIEDYVQDTSLRKTMDTAIICEKNGGRIERRQAFTSCDIDWLGNKSEWTGLSCIGVVHTQFTYKNKTTSEWHYYISNKKLTPEELLKHARAEWAVESMHWLLDVHFGEDFCRIKDENVQLVLNNVRKIALNCIKTYKLKANSKAHISNIMFDALLHPIKLIPILRSSQN